MRKAIGISLAAAMAATAIITSGVTTGATAQSCPPIADTVGGLLPRVVDGKTLSYTVLEYKYVKGIGTLRNMVPEGSDTSVRAMHLNHEKASEAWPNCMAVNIGAIGARKNVMFDKKAPESPTNPSTEPTGALVIFRPGVTMEQITTYAHDDPYNTYNLIKDYEIYPFTVVG